MKKKNDKYITRNYSVITGLKNLEHVHTIKRFPALIGVTGGARKDDLLAELSFSICLNSGVVQLDKILDPRIVYQEYHSEALGKTWVDHHAKFIEFVSIYKPKKILEIGGSNGYIAKEYSKNNEINSWTIVEPNPSFKSTSKIKVIKKIFDGKFRFQGKVDAIIHSHTLEHMYEPGVFLEKTHEILEEEGLNIFSVPNLYAYLRQRQSNVMNFEHTILLTEYFIDELLKMYGFDIIEKKYYEKHSIFYAARKTSREKEDYTGRNRANFYKKSFKNYIKYYESEVNMLNKKIKDFDGNVYLFGAHVFSQFLLSMGLKGEIKGIIDNSTIKQGKRLYGFEHIVMSPEIILNKKSAVILKAGSYQAEIERQLKEINPNVQIWS